MKWQAHNPSRQPLFVYGTLRYASGHPMSRALAHNAQRLGPGAIRGRKRYLGPYPAVVHDENASWVAGDVFKILGGQHVWRVLDIYEGCQDAAANYQRRRIPVWLVAGERRLWITAWCYLMDPTDAVSA